MLETENITPIGASDGRNIDNPSMNAKYEYDTLPKDKYIRYLILDPGQSEAPLSGRLVTEQIDKLPKYDAISYVWGLPTLASQISCNGKIIRLTATLGDLLKRVRLPNQTRNIWADQVCINQEDLAERSYQVTLMSAIYSKSVTTLVWLGNSGDSNTDELCSLIADVNTMIKAQLQECNGSWDDLPLVSESDAIARDRRWDSLAKLTSSNWFNRVWVVQEAGLSPQPEIWYGSQIIDWESCFTAISWLRHRGSFIAYNFRIEWHAIHLDRLNIWAHPKSYQTPLADDVNAHLNPPGYDWSFLDVLHFSRQLKATEPKDHIYAFLGHESASNPSTGELVVTPNYAAGLLQVYSDLAVHWIQWTKDLNILSFVQHRDETRSAEVASWVPMWNVFDSSVLAQLGETIFDAGRGIKTTPQIMADEKCLKVRGIVFDKLEYCSKAFNHEDFRWEGESNDKLRSVEDYQKWSDILSHVFNPSTKSIYVADQRFMTCAITLTAGMHSGPVSEFVTRASAFLSPCLAKTRTQPQTSTDQTALPDSQLCEVEMATPLVVRKFMTTSSGYFGLAPPTASEGDVCCVIFGCRTPFILRSRPESPGAYEFIGEAYVHEMMKGEVVDMYAEGRFREVDMILF